LIRFLAFVAAAIGLAAWLRRRQAQHATPGPSPVDELRARLAEAESRTDEKEPEPQQEEPSSDVDRRRREVHDQARRSLDELS